MAPFRPTCPAVYSVRAILASRKLPNELILAILDHAQYWVERRRGCTDLKVLMDEDFSFNYTAAYPYLGRLAFPIRSRFGTEAPKIKEIEFLIVSHDQGWTSEDTSGTYETSSWFEVSILRPAHVTRSGIMLSTIDEQEDLFHRNRDVFSNVKAAARAMFPKNELQLVRRPSSDIEPQRLHCSEMVNVTRPGTEDPANARVEFMKEGEHAWYLQSNEVARGTSIFSGEMVRRYTVVWGSKSSPRWVGNEGTGSGKDFVDSLQKDDWIVVWARAKRRGWENHIYGVRVTIRYTI